MPTALDLEDLGVLLPYAHPTLSALAGVLAPRESWSPGDLARVSRLVARHAGPQLHLVTRFDPVDRWYLRLALTEDVEVWLLSWTPGQGTRPHDHGGASGAYTVLRGEITEALRGEITEAWRDGPGPARPPPGRLRLGVRPGPDARGPERGHPGRGQRARVLAAAAPARHRRHAGEPARMTAEELLAAARARISPLSPAAAAAARDAGAVLVDIRPHAFRAAEGEIPGRAGGGAERAGVAVRAGQRLAAAAGRRGRAGRRRVQRRVRVQPAADTLRQVGVARATDLAGGFRAWAAAGLPTVPGGSPAVP